MPFARLLDQLVEETSADLAVFCDYEGEAIVFSAREGLDPFDVKVSGAQLGALLLKLQQVIRESGQSARLGLTCIADEKAFLIEVLEGGYYVVLGTSPNSLWVRSRQRLRELADRFQQEL